APKAQFVGVLAPNEKSGDDNVRLGFEIHGALSQPFDPKLSLPQRNADVDVYSFQAKGGTEAWIDMDRTYSSLDAVIEVIDALGGVVARSNNSPTEREDPSQLFGLGRNMMRG